MDTISDNDLIRTAVLERIEIVKGDRLRAGDLVRMPHLNAVVELRKLLSTSTCQGNGETYLAYSWWVEGVRFLDPTAAPMPQWAHYIDLISTNYYIVETP